MKESEIFFRFSLLTKFNSFDLMGNYVCSVASLGIIENKNI